MDLKQIKIKVHRNTVKYYNIHVLKFKITFRNEPGYWRANIFVNLEMFTNVRSWHYNKDLHYTLTWWRKDLLMVDKLTWWRTRVVWWPRTHSLSGWSTAGKWAGPSDWRPAVWRPSPCYTLRRSSPYPPTQWAPGPSSPVKVNRYLVICVSCHRKLYN